MWKSFFVFVLLLYITLSEKNEFLCKSCGRHLSSFEDLIDRQAGDSEGKEYMEYISEDKNVLYDVFPENKPGEVSDLVYFNSSDEKNLIILPEKQPSKHFEGYNYQIIRCRHCNELIGYLYTPINGTFESIQPTAKKDTSLSILDFCPYTKCWDVAKIIENVVNEVQSLRYMSGISTITCNSDFTIINQTMYSPTKFDFSFLSVFSTNASSVFGYDYSKSPPEPFYSFYLSPSNDTVHIDLEKIKSDNGLPMIALHFEEGEGMTEIRFKHCPHRREPAVIQSIACRQEAPKYCKIEMCIGDFAILKSRPEGSFFGLHAESIVLDGEEMEEEFQSLDHFSHLFNLNLC